MPPPKAAEGNEVTLERPEQKRPKTKAPPTRHKPDRPKRKPREKPGAGAATDPEVIERWQRYGAWLVIALIVRDYVLPGLFDGYEFGGWRFFQREIDTARAMLHRSDSPHRRLGCRRASCPPPCSPLAPKRRPRLTAPCPVGYL